MGRIFYNDLILDIDENVYEPREDSFLLAKNLQVKKKEKVLEIGTGSGLIAILAASKGAKVVATDLNEFAILCAQKNSLKNAFRFATSISSRTLGNNANGIDFRVGNLFEPIKPREKFDLIIFNPPYLPAESSYTEKPIDLSYNSSDALMKFLILYKNFLRKNGRAIIVNSTLSGIQTDGKIIAEQKLAFEKIFVVELNHENGSLNKISE